MNRRLVLALTVALAALAAGQAGAQAPAPAGKLLFVYDEENKYSAPYIQHFRAELKAAGLAFDESSAEGLKGKDLSSYDRILAYAIVQAFAMKEPLRDWLGSNPDLGGKKVSLFVTANRWSLAKLFGQLQGWLKQDGAQVIDAVSMATKDVSDTAKGEAVSRFVAGLAH